MSDPSQHLGLDPSRKKKNLPDSSDMEKEIHKANFPSPFSRVYFTQFSTADIPVFHAFGFDEFITLKKPKAFKSSLKNPTATEPWIPCRQSLHLYFFLRAILCPHSGIVLKSLSFPSPRITVFLACRLSLAFLLLKGD